MTKVKGSHFNRAMEFNFITINQGTVRIHSFDKNGLGLLRNEPNEYKEAAEDLRFFLNKADMNVLAKFEDLEISMNGNTIRCLSGSSSFRLQNTTDMKELAPDMKDLVNLNIDLDTYALAASFAGKVEDDGVLVAETGVTMFDSGEQFLFRMSRAVDLAKMINIPTGILKIIDKSKPYMLMANEKVIVLRTAGEIAYGPLFLKLNEQAVKFNPQPDGNMKIFSIEDFTKHLTIASNFSRLVTLTIKDGGTLQIESGAGGCDERLYKATMNVVTNVSEYSKAFSVSGLLRVLKAAEAAGEFTLYFNNRLIMARNEKNFASISVTNFHDNIDMVLNGQEEKNDGTESESE